MRLIDAGKLEKNMVARAAMDKYKARSTWAKAISMIHDEPSAQPERKTRGYWIAPKVWHQDYVDKWINGWERRTDNDTDMLECPKCMCRVFAEEYIYAVGAQGFNFCPYCGSDMRGSQE